MARQRNSRKFDFQHLVQCVRVAINPAGHKLGRAIEQRAEKVHLKDKT